MNLLFLTLAGFNSINEHMIYTDLLREFAKNGHNVYAISPIEKREKVSTHLIVEDHSRILRLKIGNTQKTNFLEKGISTLLIEVQFKKAIRSYFNDVKFDLVLYSTPPITFVSTIEYVKKRDGARSYLLLKDIFPQNAVDIGILKKTGLKGFLHKHFRKQEKRLYSVSDGIGCMSQANVDYVIKHNPDVNPAIVEVCPNSVEVIDKSVDDDKRKEIRIKYKIPLDKKVFVYGGNLGKPQGIPFLIECLKKCEGIEDAFFLIVGDGTEYGLVNHFVATENPLNVKLMKWLPKDDYDTVLGACDVGLIFLDHRFTIPNFPSRLLSYMQAKLPVLACTDPNTDIGKVIVDGGFGWWCEGNDADCFREIIIGMNNKSLSNKGNAGYKYLSDHYSAQIGYQIIIKAFS